jgi:hypothetical protein
MVCEAFGRTFEALCYKPEVMLGMNGLYLKMFPFIQLYPSCTNPHNSLFLIVPHPSIGQQEIRIKGSTIHFNQSKSLNRIIAKWQEYLYII